MEQVKGVEPSYRAWEARVLPMNYTCIGYLYILPRRGGIVNRCFRSVFVEGRETEKENPEPFGSGSGGDEEDRTPYLLNAIQALSQVSYTPTGLPSFLTAQLL